MISPYNHQSHGMAERCIRTIKGLIRKIKDPWMALLIWRSTPVGSVMQSPAELLNGCAYRSNLAMVKEHCGSDQYEEKLVAKQAKAIDYYDRKSKELLSLHKGQEILYEQNPNSKVTQWNKGGVLDNTDCRYVIQNESGCKITQNQVYLKHIEAM